MTTWSQALAWRLRRQLLDPVGTCSVAGVVRRLGAVPAYPDDAAELAIRLRQDASGPGEVAAALADGTIVKSFAFRGATHLLTPEEGGAFLALRAASRMWELPSWQSYYDLAPGDWPAFRATVREALADGPLTRDELAAAVGAERRFRHQAGTFDDSHTLLKALAWQGDLSFGPPRGQTATFQLLERNPRWAGLPELEDAGRSAIEIYLRAYGPATTENVQYWLGTGLGAGRRRVSGWLARLEDRLADVEVDGTTAHVLRDDLEELHAAAPTGAVRLLPGHDQWVLGPGTTDPNVVPPARRKLVTNGANLVLAGGALSGVWTLKKDDLAVAWFAEAGRPPEDALAAEARRLAAILGRPLELRVVPMP